MTLRTNSSPIDEVLAVELISAPEDRIACAVAVVVAVEVVAASLWKTCVAPQDADDVAVIDAEELVVRPPTAAIVEFDDTSDPDNRTRTHPDDALALAVATVCRSSTPKLFDPYAAVP